MWFSAQNLPINRIIFVRIWLWEWSLKSVFPLKHQCTWRGRWGKVGEWRNKPSISVCIKGCFPDRNNELWKAFYKRFLAASSDAELPLLLLQELRWGWAHLGVGAQVTLGKDKPCASVCTVTALGRTAFKQLSWTLHPGLLGWSHTQVMACQAQGWERSCGEMQIQPSENGPYEMLRSFLQAAPP